MTMYDLKDGRHTSRDKPENKYAALTGPEKEYLIRSKLIYYCDNCGLFHRVEGITWEQIEAALESPNIPVVETPPSKPARRKRSG